MIRVRTLPGLSAVALLCAFLLVPLPVRAAALEKMDGVWIFDPQATFAETPGLEEAMLDAASASPDQIRLILNAAENTVQLLVSAQDTDEAQKMTIVTETEDEALVGIQGTVSLLTLTGENSLRLGPNPNEGSPLPPIHFRRAPFPAANQADQP